MTRSACGTTAAPPDCTGGQLSAGSSGSAASHSEALSGHIRILRMARKIGIFANGRSRASTASLVPSVFLRHLLLLWTSSQKRLLHSMTECVALAMDRSRHSLNSSRPMRKTVAERSPRQSLRSISHDLRTPLAGIIGTSEMIAKWNSPDSHVFPWPKESKDADWLHSLVENILSLDRIQDGRLAHENSRSLRKKLQRERSPIFPKVPRPGNPARASRRNAFIPVDAKLITQVIVKSFRQCRKAYAPGQ